MKKNVSSLDHFELQLFKYSGVLYPPSRPWIRVKTCSQYSLIHYIQHVSYVIDRELTLTFFLFQFKNLPYADTFDKTLMFTIFDYDRFSKHDRIGEVGGHFISLLLFSSQNIIQHHCTFEYLNRHLVGQFDDMNCFWQQLSR
jgi:hypothetical protein